MTYPYTEGLPGVVTTGGAISHTLVAWPVLHRYTMEIATHTSRRYLILIATMAIMFSIITTLLIRHCLTNMVVTLIVILAVLVTRLLVLLQFSIGVLFRRTTRDKFKFSKCVPSATRPSKVDPIGKQV